VITKMRKNISVSVVSDFGASQDLQAFRITYSGREPHLVAQVTDELASQFIDENLKAKESAGDRDERVSPEPTARNSQTTGGPGSETP
jgi:hypothetical protein